MPRGPAELSHEASASPLGSGLAAALSQVATGDDRGHEVGSGRTGLVSCCFSAILLSSTVRTCQKKCSTNRTLPQRAQSQTPAAHSHLRRGHPGTRAECSNFSISLKEPEKLLEGVQALALRLKSLPLSAVSTTLACFEGIPREQSLTTSHKSCGQMGKLRLS